MSFGAAPLALRQSSGGAEAAHTRAMNAALMDTEDITPRRTKARLVAVIGTAALAVPGGVLVGNAPAADGSSGATTAPIQQSEDPYAPAQDERREGERPDGRDCPERDGGGSGQGGSGQSATPSTGDDAQQTAL